MMGFLWCPCERVILPGSSQGKKLIKVGEEKGSWEKDVLPCKTETIEVEGKDPGWT